MGLDAPHGISTNGSERPAWLVFFFFLWNLFGIFTLIAFSVEFFKSLFVEKKQRVKTYTSELFKKLNIGFFICLMSVILAMNIGISPVKGFPLLMSIYGFWIFIYGALLNFKPSFVGAYVTWALAFTAMFQNSFLIVMLLHGAAALVGYIIPGHIANKRFNESSKAKNI